MKRILVTGSNGLLGQTLTELLQGGTRAELIASSKGANRYPDSDGYAYTELDISDNEQLSEVISVFKPDVIINTAAITNVDVCHLERDLCRKVNVDAVRDLVAICEAKNIHLIHLSTDFVFDGESGPYAEDAILKPISFYGESKYEAEKIIQGSVCRWTILRTILVYGVTANMSRSNIVLWAKSALEKRESIKVVNDQWRMPTLALDLAEACLLVVEKEAAGIFHISGNEMMSVYELVQKVAEYWNLDQALILSVSSGGLNQEAKRPRKTGFILQKAISILGYRPHSFSEGLKMVDKQLSRYGKPDRQS